MGDTEQRAGPIRRAVRGQCTAAHCTFCFLLPLASTVRRSPWVNLVYIINNRPATLLLVSLDFRWCQVFRIETDLFLPQKVCNLQGLAQSSRNCPIHINPPASAEESQLETVQ